MYRPRGCTAKEAIDFNIKINKKTGCWESTLKCDSGNGYKQICWEGKMVLMHRLAYETYIGPIPSKLQIDHLCRVRHCCNPKHLELVTSKENTRRGEGGKHQANKTHCKRGHEFNKKNTLITPVGSRRCRPCNNAHAKRYYREARENLTYK